jgi:hypothetical protein
MYIIEIKNGVKIFYDDLPVCCQCTEMAASIVNLLIHHHGSFSEPDLEYVGGDVMHLEGLDPKSLSFWDITNILEDYLEYNYKDIPSLMLYYKYDDETNDYIRGLANDKDIMKMLKEVASEKKKRLHVFVIDIIAKEVPIEVRPPLMMISQLPAEEAPQEHVQDHPEEHQAANLHPEKDEECICQAKEDTIEWFQSWYETDTSKNIGDISNEPDEDDGNSDGGISSIDSDDVSEGSPSRVRRKYPQWMEKADLKERVELYIGQEFVDPRQFKDALQLFALQNYFDYTYARNEKTRVTALCKKTCGWKIHASWSNDKGCFQIKSYIKEHNCGTHYYSKKATIKWVTHRYLDNFRDQPNFKCSALKEMIRRDYNVEMTLLSCQRAKRMSMGILTGKKSEQYKHVREYGNALRKWNPGTSAYIQRDGRFFQRMYVSLAACYMPLIYMRYHQLIMNGLLIMMWNLYCPLYQKNKEVGLER